MKFSLAAFTLASTAWANPLASGNSVADSLEARTGATYYHAGSDLILRAVSSDFAVVGTAALTERQAAELNAAVGQPMTKRVDVNESELLQSLAARVASSPDDLFDVEKRQSCSSYSCYTNSCGPCRCQCSGGQFEVCRCV
ncbi:hypothetical protein F5X68DRAFT_248078 [Plectosphaerella plurivora]|uniref:Uncharacterized protein n=1 Tax=Plectosphaerella plurivora TaxID=936078 RepID=A0A9P8VJW1_9PEZI|nr:hypothetical protein F5X68DRAFT_248078 [Plectosphaerella plurivora]